MVCTQALLAQSIAKGTTEWQVAIRTMMMTMVVVTALGRWMFMKDQLLSTEVVFLISSATSVVGGGGGEAALHILAVQWSGCQ